MLYVFAFVGRGPYKEEASEVPTTQAQFIAEAILMAAGKRTLPPIPTPVKVPLVVRSANRVERVLVGVDGQPAGATETITDVGQLAVQQYQAVYPYVIARAVARRAVKTAAVVAVKEGTGGNGWVGLAMEAAGVAWEASESADTRCWALLPDTIQVLRVELPAGAHRLTLRPGRAATPIGPEALTTVAIEDGRNTYALVCCPDTRVAGQVLVSGTANPPAPHPTANGGR